MTYKQILFVKMLLFCSWSDISGILDEFSERRHLDTLQ